MTMYYPVPPFGVGERGEILEGPPKLCPCGEKAAPLQVHVTAWYDPTGRPERWEITALCEAHRARRPGEN
jgi:hypothetical protein